ncbi:MAG: MMPL family transporter, partial [Synechococcales cyanobacterium CRU_2_2]|nr:MMPL family transporter [Synechococcales cyanobacterium CRU_2_2]
MVQPNQNASLRQRLNLSSLALSYPRLTLGFWIAIAVAGLLAFSSLKYALFPDITFPVVVVDATAPTETVWATEQQLAIPLETRLRQLEGLDGLKTSVYNGRTALTLSFRVGADLDASGTLVEQALSGVSLPQGSSYKVLPFNLNESAAVSYAVYQPGQSVAELLPTVRDRLLPKLAEIPGVLKVELRGDGGIADGETLVRFNGQDALALEIVKASAANTLEVVDLAEKAVAQLQPSLPFRIEQASTQAKFIKEATRATLEDLFMAIALAVVIIFPFLWSVRATLIAALAIPISLLGTFIVMAIAGFNLETITLLALALVIGIIIDDAIVDVENITRHIEAGESPKQAAHKATAEIGLTVAAATLTIVAVFLPIGLMGGTVGQFFKPFGLTVSAAVLISLLVSRTLSPVLSALWLKRPKEKPAEETVTPSPSVWSGALDLYRALLVWALRNRWWVVALAAASFVAGLALMPLIPKGFIPKLDRGTFNLTYVVSSDRLATGIEDRFSQQFFQRYTVQSGDTWEAIATTQLGSPYAASQLAQTNQLDPNSELQPGQSLKIPTAAALEAAQSGLEPKPSPGEITQFSLQESKALAEQLEASVRQNPNVESVFAVLGDRGAINQGRLFVQLKDDRQVHTAIVQDQVRQALPNLDGLTASVEDIQFVDTGGEKPLQVALQGEDLALLRQTGAKLAIAFAAKVLSMSPSPAKTNPPIPPPKSNARTVSGTV